MSANLEPKVNLNERDYSACWIGFAFENFDVISCCVYHSLYKRWSDVVPCLQLASEHGSEHGSELGSWTQTFSGVWIHDFEFVLDLLFECNIYSSSSFPLFLFPASPPPFFNARYIDSYFNMPNFLPFLFLLTMSHPLCYFFTNFFNVYEH